VSLFFSTIYLLPSKDGTNYLISIFILLVILCLGSALIVFYIFQFFNINQKICDLMAQAAGIIGAIFWFYLIF